MARALPVRSNPFDIVPMLLLVVGGAWLLSRVGGVLGGGQVGGGTPGTPATPGGRDEWWNPSDPIYGPAAPQEWLTLLDAGNRRIYARGGRIFRSDATLVPTGEVLFLAPDAIARLFGWAVASFGYDYVARVGLRNNGDGTLTDQIWGIRIGIDQLTGGVAG
jgi:hypothetical protein